MSAIMFFKAAVFITLLISIKAQDEESCGSGGPGGGSGSGSPIYGSGQNCDAVCGINEIAGIQMAHLSEFGRNVNGDIQPDYYKIFANALKSEKDDLSKALNALLGHEECDDLRKAPPIVDEFISKYHAIGITDALKDAIQGGSFEDLANQKNLNGINLVDTKGFCWLTVAFLVSERSHVAKDDDKVKKLIPEEYECFLKFFSGEEKGSKEMWDKLRPKNIIENIFSNNKSKNSKQKQRSKQNRN